MTDNNRAARRRHLAALRKAKAAADTAAAKAIVQPNHANVTAAMALAAVVKLGEAKLGLLPRDDDPKPTPPADAA